MVSTALRCDQSKQTENIRLVFDAAAQTDGVFLNSRFAKGTTGHRTIAKYTLQLS